MRIWSIMVAALLLFSPSAAGGQGGQQRLRRATGAVIADHKNFYTVENLIKSGLGLGLAGVLANTSADGEIQDWYRKSLRTKGTDDLSTVVKPLGNGRIAMPVYVCALVLGELTGQTRTGGLMSRWAGRSLRMLAVGVPSVLLLQVALGASRPAEDNSRWRPFEDDNGVSGHSFVGAIPFICMAKMMDKGSLKVPFYAGSTLCGLSRINDDAHYFSQAAMGWWLAYLAGSSVEETEKKERRIQLMPMVPAGEEVSIVAVIVRF